MAASAFKLSIAEDSGKEESREEDSSIDSCVRDVGLKWWARQSERRKAKPTAAAVDPFWVKYTSGFAKEQHSKVATNDHQTGRSGLDPTMWNKIAVKVRDGRGLVAPCWIILPNPTNP